MSRRKARIRLKTSWLRKAVVPQIGELLGEAGALVSERMQQNPGYIAPRRRTGRGSQLSAVQQLAVMYAGAVYIQNANEIARRFGFHRRTVQRIFRTRVYLKFRDEVMSEALHSMRW